MKFLQERYARFLFNADPGAGGGGGGGNTGGGGEFKPDEFKKSILDEVGKMVNGAITSAVKKLDIGESIKTAIGGLKLDEKFQELESKIGQGKPPEGGAGGGKPPPSETDKKLAQLEAQLNEEKTARQKAEQAQKDGETARKFDAAKLALRAGLKESAAEDFIDDWVDRLSVIDKRLSVAEDGSARLRVTRIPYTNAEPETVDLTLQEAIPLLLKEPASKKYQPAPNGEGGGGSRGPRHRTGPTNPNDPMAKARSLAASVGVDLDKELSS